ncbi:DUF4157 domain-containing protein [Streptomyces anulatus]|uniref:eCIS core domain-containing protein n=1 Tax=Streptomyces anulatus TaxID=1892 RepID=UPI0036FA462B
MSGRADTPLTGLMALQAGVGNAAVVQMLRQAGHAEPQPEQPQHEAGCGHQQSVQPVVQRSTVHDVLRTAGRPMDDATRSDMENRLGADFSDVRIHSDVAAKASAAEVGARAYTSGNHVVIGAGGADRHTLAHELTHVIQQRQGPVAGSDNGAGLKVSDPSDRFEREAEAMARKVMSSGSPGPVEAHQGASAASGESIQRMPEQANEDEDYFDAVDYIDKSYPGMTLKIRRDLMEQAEEKGVFADIFELNNDPQRLVIWDSDDYKYVTYDPEFAAYKAALAGDLNSQADLKGMYEVGSDSTYHYSAGYNGVKPGVRLESCRDFSVDTIGYETVVEVSIDAILKEATSLRPDVGADDNKQARRSESIEIAIAKGNALTAINLTIGPDGSHPDMAQGNHRLHAAKKAGYKYVPVAFLKS